MAVASVVMTAARITHEIFILPNHARIAAAQSTMWVLSEDGQSTMQVPVIESVKETGIIPAGYCVDFIPDPATAVKCLAEQGITTVNVYEKRALTEQTLSDAESAA
ncbi:hypothetical protein BDQ12DRAFT_760002 [Crucibulum laeve]|uniref:Uncharacterized protein n=1 Tax=Crucibulum laeve TaxID=68775 RepID=A0A5C3LRE5_9AGAR|nr:hypothetical protein BDQ12DRAFT_760002 [Crucibulum laeve]